MTPSMWFAFLFIALGLLVATWVLYRKARRGVAVGQTPHCAQCGFNLTGRSPETSRCSECGADLSSPEAIHIGERRTDRAAMTAAIVCLGLALGLGGIDATMLARMGVYPVTPVWLLTRMATSHSPGLRSHAMTELTRRDRRRELDHEDLRTIALRLIDVQADESIPWQPQWTWWLSEASDANQFGQGSVLNKLELRRSVEQTPFHPTLWMRPKITDAREIRIWTTCPTLRGGGNLPMHYAYRDRQVWIDERPLPQPDSPDWAGSVFSFGGTGMLAHFNPQDGMSPLQPGVHRLRYHQRASVRAYDRDGKPGEPLRWVDLDYAGTFELLPAAEEAVTQVANPGFAAAIQKAIHVEEFEVRAGRFSHLNVAVDNTLPMDIAFEVIAMVDGKEESLGRFCARTGTRSSIGFGGREEPLPDAMQDVDLILRSKPQAAEDSALVTQIWQGEITLPKVPIVRRGE